VGDGDGEAEGVGDGDGLGGALLGGRLVAGVVFAVAVLLCEVSTMTSIITPARTAITTAPAMATAERKLMSSIRAYSALRSRPRPLPPLTT
jgi:hypothetical protein